MKAVVYAVETGEGWRARFSIAWEVDVDFWGRRGGRRICRIRQSLPLGLAEAAVEWLAAELRNPKAGERTAESVERELIHAVELAWIAAGEMKGTRRVKPRRERVFGMAGLKGQELGAVQEAGGRSGRWTVEGVRLEGVGRDEARNGALESERHWGKSVGMGAGEACFDGAGTAAEALEREAKQAAACLQGRSLLREEIAALFEAAAPSLREEPAALRALQLAALRGAVRLAAAIEPAAPARGRSRRRRPLRCRRCGSGEERMRRTRCASCGRSGCAVCEACATMGRSRECGLLALGVSPREQPLVLAPGGSMDRWGLSPAQRDASAAAVRFLREGRAPASAGLPWLGKLCSLLPGLRPNDAGGDRSFLLWAVTGAGKTEMIFPLLDAVLSAGGRALVATPRRDVVLELAPRLAKAFPEASRAVLYGGSEDRWENAALTLATTHQLLRFQAAFDLVLIDELDAFPYHGDPILHYAAAKSRKAQGTTVLLSATPPKPMQRAVKRGRLPCARVPVRYHRHPLPVPRRLALPPLHRWAGKRRLPASLGKQLSRSLDRGAQLFVFVPYIKHVQPLVELLRRHASQLKLAPRAIEGTSSVDPGRTEKVVLFRQASLRVLITTTILERGVTIPRSDVFILDAQQRMFDEAALVQMAGRAGRSGDDPNGRVFFCSAYRTSSQRGAERQIRAMNRIARRRGYLLGKKESGK
ncbi:hypothetical protein J19TS2_18280 [Cohnella xylanilytica]|uniref:DEAD/DEAH box helicase n=1 Tax=Cohnella xylanilytica TaxID=557555 RepID=UPI001B138CC3|nr:DEAD/DEAH box helicase [Cohnella xylanilytica]GIO12273.1 hypothetical protein J19TS2_18280 [Cohnella xylanilytica]